MVLTRAQKHARETTFRFQDLPGEQRNAVYRALFDGITRPTKDFDLWDEEVPEYHLVATYTSLIRVNRAVSFEARTIFEKEYLPKMPIYFNDLRSAWEYAARPSIAGLRNGGARYVLRTPVGRENGHAVCSTQSITGHKNNVGLNNLPFEFWKTMEEILQEGLGGEEAMTWTWEGGAAIKAKVSGTDISCVISVPLSMPCDVHPDLTFFSRFEVGGDGITTATIEGRLRDLKSAREWHSAEDVRRLNYHMESWEEALHHGLKKRCHFDSLEDIRGLRRVFERE